MLTGNHLGMAGRWRIDLVVRRDGLDDSIARFEWNVVAGAEGRSILLVAWTARLFAAGALALL
ncbi:MAG: hypothetical protein ACREH3_11170, partial [Geminicoccales bacterium]